jgi:hypothetical protein
MEIDGGGGLRIRQDEGENSAHDIDQADSTQHCVILAFSSQHRHQ